MSLTECRPAAAGEEAAIARMMARTFLQDVAPGYSLAGILEFLAFIAPVELERRREDGNRQWVAAQHGKIVGFAESREARHLVLLFTAVDKKRQGIGSALLETVRRDCRASLLERTVITVNSSPFAVPFYRAAGFRPFVEEQWRNGICYQPMAAPL